MRLVMHVFRKDALRLRWPVLLSIGLVCAWAAAESLQSDASPGWLGATLQPLVSLVWLYLVARVVQEEALASDRQDWLTRPYSRLGLALSKAVFVLVFVHGPYVLGCAAILWVRGFAPWEQVGALLARQAVVAAAITVPAAAVASVTRTFAQFCAGVFVLLLGGFAIVVGKPWITMDAVRRWLGAAMLCGAGVGVLSLQYRWRRTLLAGSVGACVALFAGALFAWTPSVHTEGWRCGLAMSLEWVQERARDPRAGVVYGRDMYSSQVELRGTRPGQARHPRMLALSVAGPGGEHWSLGPQLVANVETWGEDHERLRLLVGNDLAGQVRGQRVTLRGVLQVDVTNVHPVERFAVDGVARHVPWVGRCRAVMQAENLFMNRDLLKVFCEAPRGVPVLAKAVLRGEGEETWEQGLGDGSLHHSGFDWSSPLDRRQTYFPIVDERAPGAGNKWLVPREALRGARVEIRPEEPVGCAIVAFEAVGKLDHAAGRFWPVMERK